MKEQLRTSLRIVFVVALVAVALVWAAGEGSPPGAANIVGTLFFVALGVLLWRGTRLLIQDARDRATGRGPRGPLR